MTRVLIIEDEQPAVKRLTSQIEALPGKIEIITHLDSIEDAVSWFKSNEEPDLIFSDIHLADGISFSIFDQIKVSCPVIFTTAYDEYAVKAFEVNSIDYLLKPINDSSLLKAWNKFQNFKPNEVNMKALMQSFLANNQQSIKERFLVKIGDQFKYLNAKDAAYFISIDSTSFFVNSSGERYIVDEKLDELENSLSKKDFFRINRKLIVKESSVKKISSYFNSRLKLELGPPLETEAIVARERVSDFKKWLGN